MSPYNVLVCWDLISSYQQKRSSNIFLNFTNYRLSQKKTAIIFHTMHAMCTVIDEAYMMDI